MKSFVSVALATCGVLLYCSLSESAFAPNAERIGEATVCATCTYLCLKTSVAACKTCFASDACSGCGSYYTDKCSLLDKGIASGVEELPTVMPTVCPYCNPQLIATPADPDVPEDLCDAQAYLRAIETVGLVDLSNSKEACSSSYKQSLVVGALFGPPSNYEMFTQTCHGPCQSYTRRLSPHFDDMLRCNCTFLRDRGVMCFPSAEQLMCEHVGMCPETVAFEEKYCVPEACGRNEGKLRALVFGVLVCFTEYGMLQAMKMIGEKLLLRAALMPQH